MAALRSSLPITSNPQRGAAKHWIIGCSGCLGIVLVVMFVLGLTGYRMVNRAFGTIDVAALVDPKIGAKDADLFPEKVGDFKRQSITSGTALSLAEVFDTMKEQRANNMNDARAMLGDMFNPAVVSTSGTRIATYTNAAGTKVTYYAVPAAEIAALRQARETERQALVALMKRAGVGTTASLALQRAQRQQAARGGSQNVEAQLEHPIEQALASLTDPTKGRRVQVPFGVGTSLAGWRKPNWVRIVFVNSPEAALEPFLRGLGAKP